MVSCKHWKNGRCKNCKKKCSKKKALNKRFAKEQLIKKQAALKKLLPTQILQEISVPVVTSAVITEESLTHGTVVAAFAQTLFTALAPVHKCTALWQDVLHHAALLHDIGWIKGKKEHHKTGARMIRQRKDVPKHIRPLVALVARYQRRAAPSLKHSRFAALPRSMRYGVRYMAALLRIADALDFGHMGVVQSIEVKLHKTYIGIMAICTGDCSAEVARVSVKKDLFVQFYKRDVQCSCEQTTPML